MREAAVRIRELWRPTAEKLRQAGIAEAQLEAELLLRYFFGLNRVELHLSERLASPAQLAEFSALLGRRLEHQPLAYLVGEQEFWSLTFAVSEAVLIPRPETELLIEAVLTRIPAPGDFAGTILDLGSGSGVIPVVLARELPKARLVGVDLAPAALAVAAANAERHGVANRVTWRLGDWFDALAPTRAFDFVVTNPPYVAEACRSSLQPELAFEPAGALYAGLDGLDEFRRIIPRSPAFLAPGGWLIAEIGSDQGAAVAALLQAQPELESIAILRDYAGHDRLAVARKLSPAAVTANDQETV